MYTEACQRMPTTETTEAKLSFHEGQIFFDEFPQDACDWVNSTGDLYGAEIEPDPISGRKRFAILRYRIESDGTEHARQLQTAKFARNVALSQLTVTVDGLLFNADETAQARMHRTLAAVALGDGSQIKWVLADHTVAIVTVSQLQRAFKAAVDAQAELWTAPYETQAAH